MSTAPLVLLDELDAAHTAWQTGSPGWSDQAIEAMESLPKLTAALRAVLDRHHPVSQNVYAATPVKDPVDVCAIDTTTAWPCQTVRAIASALVVP